MLSHHKYKRLAYLPALSFVLLLILCSCSSSKKVVAGERNKGYFRVEKSKVKHTDSSYFNIEIAEIGADKNAGSYKPLRASDVWLNDIRYQCDRTGKVKIAIMPGNYRISARAMGFKSLSNEVTIKKGEIITIRYYLDYFQHYRPNKMRTAEKRRERV